MTKNNWLLVIFLIVLATVYVIWFTDWFKPKTIHIFDTVRMVHSRHHRETMEPRLIFGVEPAQIQLTEIKVVPLADFQKDPKTLPVWHLISDSNSVPVKNFTYGERIRGMKPALFGTEPTDLLTNTLYRIYIQAGRAKGEHDFEIGGTPTEQPAGQEP